MDFRPSPAQQLLVTTARDFLRRHCPIDVAPRLTAGARADSVDDDVLWRRMAELGWPGLLIPAEHGGSDGSILDVVLLVEEMGYAGVSGPFITSAVVATSLIMTTASERQQKRLLPPLATGDRIATVALVEESGSFDPHDVVLACDGRGRVTGTKRFVKDAHVADDLIVALADGLLVIPADRRGILRLPLDTMSGEKLFEVTFDAVDTHDDDRLATPDHAALAAALQLGALARTAEMVGAAQRILDMTVEHAKTRVQGGRPIGGYQAIQHACADLVRDVDCARGLLRVAAWRTSEGLPAGTDIAMAKAYAGEACLAVARRGHQIFGAISYCDEHPLHLFHKRIQAASVDFGDATPHLETVARAIGLDS
jgi:alkylation response protein AidB-like acyl-CoA dehydrogenase